MSATPQQEVRSPERRRRCLLLVNKRARSGACDVDGIVSVLEAAGLDVVIGACGSRDILAETIRARAAEVDLVVIGGGDGTINGAVGALLDTGLPLGILPLGTANDLARTLKLPLDPMEAAKVAATGPFKAVDVGEVNGRHFMNVASIGLSVELTRELTGQLKRRWGTLGYALAAFRVLRRIHPFTAEVRVNGEVQRVKTVQIAVGNGRYYGGGMAVEDEAQADDGKLDVYSIDVRGWWELPLLYPAFRRGRHGRWKSVRTWDCTEIEIITRRPERVNTDGELTTRTPAHFRVLPGALRIACPPGPEEASDSTKTAEHVPPWEDERRVADSWAQRDTPGKTA